jgi:hypothetical protein
MFIFSQSKREKTRLHEDSGSRTKNGREKEPPDGRAGGAAVTGAGGARTLLQAEAGCWRRSWSREAEGSGRGSGGRGGDDGRPRGSACAPSGVEVGGGDRVGPTDRGGEVPSTEEM